MNRLRPAVPLLLLCAGCASDAPLARGWLGGEYEPVVAKAFFAGSGPYLDGHRTVGLPESVGAEKGALVTWSSDDAPLRAAGIRPGDLLLRVDGREVGDSDDVREAVEAHAPGDSVALRYWRDGAAHEATAVLGTETWQKSGTFRLGLGLNSKFDLWPFDDGIDLLGLIAARSNKGVDPSSPAGEYLRRAYPGEPLHVGPLRGWEVFVVLIGVGGHETIMDQRAATRPGPSPLR